MKSRASALSQTRRAYDLAAQKYHDLFHNELREKEYDRKLLDAFAEKFVPGAVILDAGCGPSAHIGRYLFDKGLRVIGVDVSERCVEIARGFNPEMTFECEDIAGLSFEPDFFDGVVAYYSIIHTPKMFIGALFDEFHRVLAPGGYLLVAVKAGTSEGFLPEFLGIRTDIYFSLFTESEIEMYFKKAGFALDLIERRNPYDFEIKNERIFAIGRKAP